VIGPLAEVKIWSVKSRLHSSMNKIVLRSREHGETQANSISPYNQNSPK